MEDLNQTLVKSTKCSEMSLEDLRIAAIKIAAVFPSYWDNFSIEEALPIWFEYLKDIKRIYFVKGVDRVCKTLKETTRNTNMIAHIREAALQIKQSMDPVL